MPKEIKLSEIIPAGDGEIIPSDLPLFCFEFEGNLHLAPGQDKRLEDLKSDGRESYPIQILPGSMGADQLVALRDLFRAIYY